MGGREGGSLGQFLHDGLVPFVKKEVASASACEWASEGLRESYRLSRGTEKGTMLIPLSATSTALSQAIGILIENYGVLEHVLGMI